MRKLHLLLSVTMLTVTVQAQNEAKENTALSTEKKELLAQSEKRISDFTLLPWGIPLPKSMVRGCGVV